VGGRSKGEERGEGENRQGAREDSIEVKGRQGKKRR
jgi:hypothetical protein